MTELDSIIEAIAERVAEKLRGSMSEGNGDSVVRPRLLTVEQAANYLGRSKSSVQHLIADGVLPTVRHDRRVFLDVEDLSRWIEQAKV